MEVKQHLKHFLADPFAFVDRLDLPFPLSFVNPFSKFRFSRKLAFTVSIVIGLIPWVIFGFDSCVAQPVMALYRVPDLLSGRINYETWIDETFVQFYGKEMHFSAILIYGLMFWWLSRHYDLKRNIKGARNITYSIALTLLAIAIFEFTWMSSFAVLQKQVWVLHFEVPQLKIVNQNINFTIVGVLTMLYMYVDSFVLWKPPGVPKLKRHWRIKRRYVFRVDKIAVALILSTVALWVLWWNWPFYSERFSVKLKNGEVWTNSRYFPQTLYTIDMNPDDNKAMGVWHYYENNAIHGMNTLVKAMTTLCVFYVGLVKEVKHP